MTTKEVEGRDQSAHGMYDFKVYRDKGVPRVDADIDDGEVSFLVLAHDLERLIFKVYSHRADNKNEVQFLRDEASGKVAFVTFDRYLYRRV